MRTRSCGSECYSDRVPGVPVDPYVFDVLMGDLIGHDRQPSAFVLYLLIWRLTDGGKKEERAHQFAHVERADGLVEAGDSGCGRSAGAAAADFD